RHNNSWLGYGFAGDKPPRYEVFRCYLWLMPMSLTGYIALMFGAEKGRAINANPKKAGLLLDVAF
ncbi:MAG: hypothetical protein JXA30_11500, partial [Deltaproteobacteria bacterium]|nr:hypothetical protein [Deltaproteobacteria bacterium]